MKIFRNMNMYLNKILCGIIGSFILLSLSGCAAGEMDAFFEAIKPKTNEELAAYKKKQAGGKTTESGAKVMTEAEIQKEEKQAAFRKKRKDWFGYSVDDLILSWGNPSSTHKRQDGGIQYTWKRQQDSVWGSYTICTDNFVTDSKGIINDWTTSGCFY